MMEEAGLEPATRGSLSKSEEHFVSILINEM